MDWTQDKIFRWITKFSYRRSRYVILGTVILGVLSSFLVTRLQLQSDVLNLLPSNAPATSAFVKFLKDFGTADSLFIVLERKSDGEVESFGPFAEVLAERLKKTGEFGEMPGSIDQAGREILEQQFVRKALLYLTEDDLGEMETKLTDVGIRKQVQDLKLRLQSPMGSFATEWVARDPLDLWSLFRKHFPSSSQGLGVDSQGYLLSADRKMMLLITKPKGSALDIRYDEMLLEKIQAAVAGAKEAFMKERKSAAAESYQDLQIGITGGYMNALEDSRMIKKELIVNFSVSLIGVLALFVFGFRRKRAVFYALFPLLVSPLLTLGLFSPFLGRLSESTGAFSAIILGLSIDFIILLYSRYLEERNAGLGVQEALAKSLSYTGPGVFTSAVTTTAAYYALIFSDFRGVRELGLLTGTGILLSLGCAFFLFPALVAWREKAERKEKRFRPVSSFGIERLGLLALKSPSLVIFLCAAMTLATVAWALQVKLNNDPRRLRPPGQPSLVLEARVQDKMEEGLDTIMVMARSQNAEKALEVQGMVMNKFEQAVAEGRAIPRYESLASFIPPPSQQKRNLQWIERRADGIMNSARVEKKLMAVLREEGFRVEAFQPGLKMLREMLENREMLTWKQFQETPLRALGERFLQSKGDAFISVSYLHVEPNFWVDPKGKTFLESLKGVAPDIQVTGSKLVQKELEGLMTGESWRLLLIALFAVSGLVYLDFRSWRITLFSLLPVALSFIWTLGLMGMMGIDLNFMNLIVFTMVVGVGVDYGVYILHRSSEGEMSQFETGLVQVSKGVVLAVLTTLVGFGSLVLSGYPGLQSMGLVALMGVGFSALIALTLLPVLLRKRLPKKSLS